MDRVKDKVSCVFRCIPIIDVVVVKERGSSELLEQRPGHSHKRKSVHKPLDN